MPVVILERGYTQGIFFNCDVLFHEFSWQNAQNVHENVHEKNKWMHRKVIWHLQLSLPIKIMLNQRLKAWFIFKNACIDHTKITLR